MLKFIGARRLRNHSVIHRGGRLGVAGILFVSTAAFGAEWLVPLTIEHGSSTQQRIFGVDSLGTDGYDVGLDIPIPPPGVIFYSFFQADLPFPYLGTDVRSALADTVWWSLCFTGITDTAFVSWESSDLPAGGELTIDGIDMRGTTSVFFTTNGCYAIMFVAGEASGIPAQVQGLRVSDPGGDDLRLDWIPVTLDVLGNPCTVDYYTLFRSDVAYFSPGAADSIAAPADTFYVDTGIWLSPDDGHYYRVLAVNDEGKAGAASLPAGGFRWQLP